MELRQKTNKELFLLYEGELTFHHRSARGLHEAKRILNHFHEYLGEYPPSPELAKTFLAKFTDAKAATIARYGAILKMFLKWYGEELDIKFKVPKILPSYVKKTDIDKLLESMSSKKTHKQNIGRDLLLVDLAIHTGLRRSELANLKISDVGIERKVLVVRQGKGAKDRVIPLARATMEKLAAFIKGMYPDDSLFGLAPASISGKIKIFARKAGLPLHAHSLRDYFATSLSEKGATIREIQSLLGHTNLTHTERYTLHTDKHLRNAIELIDGEEKELKTIDVPQTKVSIVTIKGIYKDQTGKLNTDTRIYFSHFIISNEGKEPAIELQIGLFDEEKNLLQSRRDSVLMIGEKAAWKLNFNRPDGQYYLVCQYQSANFSNSAISWNQTWLKFSLSQADKLGEVYIAPGQLEFKNDVNKADKIYIY